MDTNNTNESTKRSGFAVVLIISVSVIGILLTGVLFSGLLSTFFEPIEIQVQEKPAETIADTMPVATAPVEYALMDNYDTFISGTMNDAYAGAKSVKKLFWIDEEAELPPVANAANYGETTDPTSLQWLIDEAQQILDGQELTFSTDVAIYPGSKVTYYLDESIFAVTWKAVYYDFVYTMCEVKVAHPSQVRRYIAEGTYGSDYLYTPTTMASSVNAVAAMSGDYYRGRNYGIVVYDGTVHQVSYGNQVDTCYVDYDGDFHFTYRGEILDKEAAQKYVDDNHISFSLAFGPILVDNGVRCEHDSYALGEVNDGYPRAAICQKDKLHYILVTANWEGPYYKSPNIHTFASVIETFQVQKAYTLDGGQTGAIAMDGKLMNPTLRGEQRRISDIVYFATAVPNWSSETEATEPTA
ncbi:MAG: phosphodiester glycosidase family protein [Oscillospiraceae bacterium]|nr:phosphodiester glycosidase family protein [Oscillospiraceae bacterium]